MGYSMGYQSVIRHLPVFVSVLALVLSSVGGAHGATEEDYWHDKERGWFWYEPEPVEKEEKPEKTAKPEKKKEEKVETVELEPKPKPKPSTESKSKPEKEKPLTAQWLRENIQKYRDKAWNDPTPDNVAAFMAMQQYMLDRSAELAAVTKQVTVANPQLDASSYRPVTGGGRLDLRVKASQQREELLDQVSDKAGLWFFYRGSTPYSAKMAKVAENMQRKHGFTVLPISLDGQPLPQKWEEAIGPSRIDQGQAEKLSVSVEPAFVLMGKDGSYNQVGQGMLAIPDLENRTLIVAYQNDWINKEQYDKTKGVLTPAGTYARQFENKGLKDLATQADSNGQNKEDGDVPIDTKEIVNILQEEVSL